MKTIEKYLNEAKEEQAWTVIRIWRINAKSNTKAIEMSKTIQHDEVIVKKGRPLIKGII